MDNQIIRREFMKLISAGVAGVVLPLPKSSTAIVGHDVESGCLFPGQADELVDHACRCIVKHPITFETIRSVVGISAALSDYGIHAEKLLLDQVRSAESKGCCSHQVDANGDGGDVPITRS